jgi:sugar transferase (PEP-CTERM/EpsH1 system associated)
MRILYIAHRVPYPPNKGEKIRCFHHLRHLGSRHEVDLVAYCDGAEDTRWAAPLASHCRRVELIPQRPALAVARSVAGTLRGRSLSEGFFASAALMRHAAADYDVVWTSSSSVAARLPRRGLARRIVDFVDVDSEKWREFAAFVPPPLAWLYALEARRVARLEAASGTSADCVLVVAESEAEVLRQRLPLAPVRVVPNGVDLSYFQPAAPAGGAPPRVVFVGTLDYRPNVDAVLFFVREVLPLLRLALPDLEFTAVGHRPAARLQRAVRRRADGVRLAGSVPDVRPYLRAAQVCVVPLQYGRGMKNKVLEAMAMGVPVVASGVAVAGLAVRDGVEVTIAKHPRDYADAICALLRSAERRRVQAEHALHYVRTYHSWERAFAMLDCILESLAPSPLISPTALR